MMIAKIIVYIKTDLLTAISTLLNIVIAKNSIAAIFKINNSKYSLFSLFFKKVIPFFSLFIRYNISKSIIKIIDIEIRTIYSLLVSKILNITKFITVETKYKTKLTLNEIVVISKEYPIFLFILLEKMYAMNISKNIILIVELVRYAIIEVIIFPQIN